MLRELGEVKTANSVEPPFLQHTNTNGVRLGLGGSGFGIPD